MMHLPPLLFGKPVSAPKMNASAMHALHTVPGLGMEPAPVNPFHGHVTRLLLDNKKTAPLLVTRIMFS
jgi:hypothetical protein